MAPRKRVEPGQRFTRLVVIRETETRKGKRYVLCRCDCGREREINIYTLLSGHAKSCGCLMREKRLRGKRATDLTGQTFGRLTARHRDGVGTSHSPLWVCECTCGNIVRVTARDLMHGNTTSCGCAVRDFTRSLKAYNEEHHTVDGVFVPLLRQKVQRNSKTGIKGVSVYRDKSGRVKYKATISINNKRIYLGLFPTIEQAAEARQRAEEKYYKPYLEAINDGQTTDQGMDH